MGGPIPPLQTDFNRAIPIMFTGHQKFLDNFVIMQNVKAEFL
jgi:hypothetical protein